MDKGVAVRIKPRELEPSAPPAAESRPAAPARSDKPGIYTRRDLGRCLIIALVVGTALVIINVRPVAGEGPDLARIFVNYLVPFLVASSSAMLANAARQRPARA